MKPLFAGLCAAIVLATSPIAAPVNAAGNCGVLCQTEFYETATPQSILRALSDGEDLHARDSMGRTPLHFVARATPQTIAAMINAGADVRAEDSLNRRPIHFVSAMAPPEVVQVLLLAGADPNARTANNWAPLHGAAKWGRPDTIRLLLDAGADPFATTDMGELPYDMVGQNELVRESSEFQVLKQAKQG